MEESEDGELGENGRIGGRRNRRTEVFLNGSKLELKSRPFRYIFNK